MRRNKTISSNKTDPESVSGTFLSAVDKARKITSQLHRIWVCLSFKIKHFRMQSAKDFSHK